MFEGASAVFSFNTIDYNAQGKQKLAIWRAFGLHCVLDADATPINQGRPVSPLSFPSESIQHEPDELDPLVWGFRFFALVETADRPGFERVREAGAG